MATIASLLRDHVTLQVRSVDRLFLQGYVPRLMTEGMVVRFLLDRGNPIPSPALLGKMGRAYVAEIDRFRAGRAWFEQTIRDQRTLGRPDQVSVVFARRVNRTTPGRFHTRVVNRGVEPANQVHYKASKVKQYFKEGRALRTETTVNDTRDFGIGRLLTQDNWAALVAIGHDINERLLSTQLEACACAPDATTLERVVLPSKEDGQPTPGLRFGDPRVMALMACLCAYSHLIEGLTNRSLRALVAGLLPGYTARQATYDLRRQTSPRARHSPAPGAHPSKRSQSASRRPPPRPEKMTHP